MIGINMSMPEKCIICPFYIGLHEGTCLISEASYGGYSVNMPEYYRQDWCPLTEIKESED